MIKFFAPAIRLILKALLWRKGKAFEASLSIPRQSQEKTLEKLLALFNASQYGQGYGKIESYDDYKNKVPIIGYDEIEEQIKTMKKKKENFFSPSPVMFYEPTSGSSGPKKYIPYTWGLKSAFSKMFSLWAWDLLRNGPSFNTGKFYFSVSPQFKDEGEGLEDDSDYLEGFFSWFLKPFFVTPKKIKRIQDPLGFKRILALHLLSEKDLEIISVWNPSTFLVILEYIDEHREELILELEKGIAQQEGMTFSLKRPNEERKLVIKEKPLSHLWPELKLISSWGSNEAEMGFNKLKKLFPQALLQQKGLLATESPLTIPMTHKQVFVPLLNDIFFEFESEGGKLFLLSELKGGETYKLIISTPGGLYRYRLGDMVRVQDFYRETPCLEFVGRGSETSDLFGEKLNINFLQQVVSELEKEHYYLFYPTRVDDEHGYYTLLTDNKSIELEETVEQKLMEAFHYKVARNLGTLRPLKVIYKKDMNERVLKYFQGAKKMKLGDIKPSLLLESFDSDYLA